MSRLSSLWIRPLAERERAPLFLIAGALVIAAALALYLSRGEPSERTDSSARAQRAAPREDPDAPRAPAAVATRARRAGLSPGDARNVERTARRFLAGYLPYAYGQAGAGSITGGSAAPELRRRLRDDPPRVPPGTARLRPRIESLQTEAASDRAAEVLVSVDDGTRRYAFPLTLERVSGRWRVSGRGA